MERTGNPYERIEKLEEQLSDLHKKVSLLIAMTAGVHPADATIDVSGDMIVVKNNPKLHGTHHHEVSAS